MKKLFSVYSLPTPVNLGLLISRLASGSFMLTHGIPKLQKFKFGNTEFMNFMGLGPTTSMALTIFAEVICAILLILGLGTRLAATFLSITMAVAAFIAHGGDSFGKKEMSLLYLTIFLFLMLCGGGKYALDNLRWKK